MSISIGSKIRFMPSYGMILYYVRGERCNIVQFKFAGLGITLSFGVRISASSNAVYKNNYQ